MDPATTSRQETPALPVEPPPSLKHSNIKIPAEWTEDLFKRFADAGPGGKNLCLKASRIFTVTACVRSWPSLLGFSVYCARNDGFQMNADFDFSVTGGSVAGDYYSSVSSLSHDSLSELLNKHLKAAGDMPANLFEMITQSSTGNYITPKQGSSPNGVIMAILGSLVTDNWTKVPLIQIAQNGYQ